MSRSVWKGPFVDGYLLKKAETVRASGRNEIIRIWSRRSTILPQFVGLTFGVYNGQKHIPVSVTEDMIGHKFGEFSPTRTFHGHSGDKKAAKPVRPGDRIEVVTPGGLRILEVAALWERRGPAAVARTLYVDHTPPPPPKEERPSIPVRDPGAGRPSKREQRLLRKLRGY